MNAIHARFLVTLCLSAVAHAGLAWVVGGHLSASAVPAQRALTVAMVAAAPRVVLNSIAPTASAARSPAVVHPVAPPSVPVLDEPDAVLVARPADRVEPLRPSLVALRQPESVVRARAPQGSPSPAPAPRRSAPASHTSKAPPARSATPAVDGDPGAGRDAASPQAVAGEPGADARARPASGNAPPEYPWSARVRGYQGRVVLSVWVDARGGADGLSVVRSSGHEALDRAAVEAVQAWRFQPARRSGAETGSLLYVPIVFRLNDDG